MANIKLSLTTALSAVSAAAGALTLVPRQAQATSGNAFVCSNTWCNPGGNSCSYTNNYACFLDAQGCYANLRC